MKTQVILKFLVFFVLINLITSCATPGNTHSNNPTSRQGTITQYTNDALITSKVKTKYLKDLSLKSFGISVSTNKGVVSLVGKLPSDALRQRAINVATQTKGVRAVNAQNLIIPAMTLEKPSVTHKTPKKRHKKKST